MSERCPDVGADNIRQAKAAKLAASKGRLFAVLGTEVAVDTAALNRRRVPETPVLMLAEVAIAPIEEEIT